MSVPNDQGRSTGTPATTAARVTSDGKRIFQMGPPVVIWWCWVALIAVSLGDLVIQGHAFVSLKFAFGALAVTGLVYACTLWPRVIADDRGIEVRNPFRRFVIPWPAVRGIFLADSVEVQCARSMPRKDKTIYSWALSSPRRTRARAQLRAWQWDQGKRNRPAGYNQLPDQARNLVKMTTAEIMARELAALSDDARFKSVVAAVDLDSTAPDQASEPKADTAPAAAGPGSQPQDQERLVQPEPGQPIQVLSATWAWPPLLAIVLPAIGCVVTTLVK
ncbi:MAG TPA: PH domain-containing protein [Streptosporangiaceae bacterium]|nr:PH domain-containing protein [Streptosporangiaceae bacterium]